MALHTKAFAFASAAVMGLVYVVCAFVSLVAPDAALKLFGWLVHLVNLEQFAGSVRVSAGGLVVGFAQAVIYGFVIGWVFAWFYNRFAAKEV